MVVTYCTADDVILFAQIRAFNGGKAVWGSKPPLPDQNDVEELIESAESTVEDVVKQAWGTRYITKSNELQDIHCSYSRRSNYPYLFLNKQSIAPFSSVEGDKLEIFEDDAWVDYLTTYTEGRGDDFFVDYEIGKIYFQNRNPPIGQQLARITYRQNSGSIVPEAIRIATALQVAILVANIPGIKILFPTGEGGGSPGSAAIENYRKLIKTKLAPHIVIVQPMNTKFREIY